MGAPVSVSVIISARLGATVSVFVIIGARLGATVSVSVIIAAGFLGAAVSVSETIISSQFWFAVGVYISFENRSHGHFLGSSEGRSLLRPCDCASIWTGLAFKTRRWWRFLTATLAFESAVALGSLGVWSSKFSHLFVLAVKLVLAECQGIFDFLIDGSIWS